MQPNPKIRKSKSKNKRREAVLMGFKLLINNQGQFVTEIKNYPLDKVSLHFSKEKCPCGKMHTWQNDF